MNNTATVTYDIGLGLKATFTYVALGPVAAPESGAEWPAESDHPRLSLRLDLPTSGLKSFASYPPLHHDLRAFETSLFGALLGLYWGGVESARTMEFSAPTAAELMAKANAEIELALATLRSVTSARAARLAARRATYLAGISQGPVTLAWPPLDE